MLSVYVDSLIIFIVSTSFGLFTAKLLRTEDKGLAVLKSERFKQALKCIDTDDFCISVIDPERMHGRLRLTASYGCPCSQLPAAALQAYLSEWRTLHSTRDLASEDGAPLDRAPMKERLRKSIEFYKAVEKDLVKNRVGYVRGGPRMLYTLLKDAQAKAASERQRSQAEYRRNFNYWQAQFDVVSADDDPDKTFALQRFADQRNAANLAKPYQRTQQYLSDIIDRLSMTSRQGYLRFLFFCTTKHFNFYI